MNDATPTASTLTVSNAVAPSLNVTEPPVTGTEKIVDTDAVNVTGSPTVDGFRDDVSTVLVITLVTNWASESLLPRNCSTGMYVATIVWAPSGTALVMSDAWPKPFRLTVPNVVDPSVNVTEPAVTGPNS